MEKNWPQLYREFGGSKRIRKIINLDFLFDPQSIESLTSRMKNKSKSKLCVKVTQNISTFNDKQRPWNNRKWISGTQVPDFFNKLEKICRKNGHWPSWPYSSQGQEHKGSFPRCWRCSLSGTWVSDTAGPDCLPTEVLPDFITSYLPKQPKLTPGSVVRYSKTYYEQKYLELDLIFLNSHCGFRIEWPFRANSFLLTPIVQGLEF